MKKITYCLIALSICEAVSKISTSGRKRQVNCFFGLIRLPTTVASDRHFDQRKVQPLRGTLRSWEIVWL